MTGRARLADLLEGRAATRPDGLAAATADGSQRTWAQAAATAAATAGLAAGRRAVGLWAPNHLDWLPALLGCWRAGATAVVVSSLAPPAEATALLRQAGADLVLTLPPWAAPLRDAGCDLPSAWPTAAAVAPPGPGAGAAPPDAGLVLFTSGTTGAPKGVVHSAASVAAALRAMSRNAGLDAGPRPLAAEDRTANAVLTPLSHTSGLLGSLFTWWAGKPLAVLDRFEPGALEAAVRRFGLRTLRLVPAMVHDLVEAGPEITLSGVRSATVGTAGIAAALRERFERRFGIPLLVTYGQTEAMGGVAAERLDDVRAGRRPEGSVGRALPGVEIRIVDAGTGAIVPAGTVGEIAVRTPRILRGYTGGGSAPVDADGFLRTGDLGRLDHDGFLFVTGRARDVIVSGGFNVYPAEVEAVLVRHPGVADVAVVAHPDERLGEIPVAAVVGDRAACSPADLDRTVRATLAPYKRPRAYTWLARLPRTEAGKVDRAAVAALDRHHFEPADGADP